jgi:hypothetical protein
MATTSFLTLSDNIGGMHIKLDTGTLIQMQAQATKHIMQNAPASSSEIRAYEGEHEDAPEQDSQLVSRYVGGVWQ